ncbi:MAG: hypothetical protein M3347_05530 [Armatimonadota bacterium]|nr:hypothetical protein [Armatimonadota bacterium]
MKQGSISPLQGMEHSTTLPEQWEDFLSPQQRVDAIAKILATIAVRIAKEHYAQSSVAN